MIKIPCSMLEQVRLAPTAYAQMIAKSDKPKSGGSHGMFAYWQDVAKLVHTDELTLPEALKELQNKFIRFDDNLRNRSKQSSLLEKLPKYIAQYEKHKFQFIDTKHKMKWDIAEGVRLTGLTPWVVKNQEGYFSYIFTDATLDWRDQLRFPLIQQYLTGNNIDCDITEMYVGIYCLETNSFDFKSYSSKEIKMWVSEAGNIFQTVLKEYLKWKN